MKRWLAFIGCALIAVACVERRPPTGPAPGLRAELVGEDEHVFYLSGVVTVDPSLKSVNGSGPAQSAGNLPGPAASVGPNVVANQDKTFFPQNETPIAVDPANPSRLLAGSNDYRHDLAACGIYASSDGGATWNDVGEGTTVPPGVVAGGDAATAFGPDGVAYHVCLGFTPVTNATSTTVLFVNRTSDLRTLQPAGAVIATVSGGTDPTFGYFNDKEFVAVDTRPGSPHRGRLYVTWTRFKFTRTDDGYVESPIVLSYSDDGGTTWNGPHPVSSPDLNFDQGSVPAIGPHGEVYVVFENGNGTGANGQAMVAKSLDGGQSFSHPVKVDDIVEICDHLNTDGRCAVKNSSWRVNSFPSIAVDAAGTVYVVWGDYRRGNADVLFSRSTNGGQSFSHSVTVNSDLSGADQFYPWVAVADNGAVQVEFQQRDDTPGNRLLNTFLATSMSGALGFGTQLRVSSGPTDPNIGFSGTFIGDYNGVAASAHAAHPIWTDARRVVCQVVVTDCQANQDAVTATVRF
jgi:hypothetical protein